LDIPLLVESGHDDLTHVLVVDVDPEIAVERLMKYRGFSEEDARNRVANQASREQRKEKAGFVIDNSGDQVFLAQQVDAAWEWIQSLDS
jgi:dephospho-CoA kinase